MSNRAPFTPWWGTIFTWKLQVCLALHAFKPPTSLGLVLSQSRDVDSLKARIRISEARQPSGQSHVNLRPGGQGLGPLLCSMPENMASQKHVTCIHTKFSTKWISWIGFC